MPAKKRSASAEKELKATIKKLRSRLERADAKADRWKKKAGTLEKAAAASEARAKKLSKRLDKASRPTEPVTVVGSEPEQPLLTAVSGVAGSEAAQPDESWTVVRLRAEARARGLSGLSNKSKAQLLGALA